jgi:Protein of unknown function (DUF1565)
MRSNWAARLFFAIVAAMALAGVISGTACTRWSHPGPIAPTISPLSSIYVDAATGSDTSGNGSITSPYKTLTKAVAVLNAAKSLSAGGVTIYLSSGDYDTANGEVFPIVIEKSVSIDGENYGTGTTPHTGSFVDGVGEDTLFESLVHAPAHTAYTTLEALPPASVSTTGVYVGVTKISLPSSQAFYASLDVLTAAVTGSTSAFGAGLVSRLRNVNGVIVPGGSFTCQSCQISGNDFGIGGFLVALPTSSPSSPSSPPPVLSTITLSRTSIDSTIAAKVVAVLTDGNVNVTASGTALNGGVYAYADAFKPIVITPIRGAVDFGGGAASSTGGNSFIGARNTEILVTRRFETVSALDDVWNAAQQGADRHGQYRRTQTFSAGASGKNVTIHTIATGSTVTVGPAPVPTPTPSSTPTSGPTSTPT